MRPGPTSLGPFDPGYRALPQALPIFPLTGAVPLSGGRLPLTIFEPRYLAMTRHALAASRRASSAWCSRWRSNADRDPDAHRRGRRCQRIGCAGRVVSVPGDRGRALSHHLERPHPLSRSKRELPLHEGGFRLVEPDFAPFAEDMAERDFEMAAKAAFLAAFKAYTETKQLKVDWDAIKGAPTTTCWCRWPCCRRSRRKRSRACWNAPTSHSWRR